MEIEYQSYFISDDPERLQIDRICALLARSYWANQRSRETIEKSIQHSLCFGVYADGVQIGFARCVTDYATIFWLGDVIVDEAYRGQGIGKVLVETIMSHEKLRGVSGILATRDAHGLYARHGFTLVDPERYMRKPAQAPTLAE
ncbi:MAG: GNAT family N-acetyltransferase [Christensenella sp.]|nr:GNAT family N-acetyltransferase [Christensenella sp.]